MDKPKIEDPPKDETEVKDKEPEPEPEPEPAKSSEPKNDTVSPSEPKVTVAEAPVGRVKTRRSLVVAEDHLGPVTDIMEDLRAQVGDINDGNYNKFVGEAMSSVSTLEIGGTVKKEIVKRAVGVVISKVESKDDRDFLERLMEKVIDRMIDMVVSAAKGQLPVVAKKSKYTWNKCLDCFTC